MPIVIGDRIRETTISTGTGPISFDGAVAGYRTFFSALGNGASTYYCMQNTTVPTEWEVGYGLITGASSFVRISVICSSNSNALVNFSSGIKDIFCTASAEGLPLVDQSICQGRLTLLSNTPISTSDTISRFIRFTPYKGSRISLFDGSKWKSYNFTELSFDSLAAPSTLVLTCTTTNGNAVVNTASTSNLFIGMPITGAGMPTDCTISTIINATSFRLSGNAVASGTNALTFYYPNYDVFIYDNAGTLTLSAVAWNNNTVRLTSLITQDGVLVMNGDESKRYLGTYRLYSGTGGISDSASKRYVWNYYNRILRNMRIVSGVNNWTYSLQTWRQANNVATNKVEYVCGQLEDIVSVSIYTQAINSSAGPIGVSMGVDTTTTPTHYLGGISVGASIQTPIEYFYRGYPGLGYHYLAWLEIGAGVGTTTWYGDNGIPYLLHGMTAELMA